MTTALIRDPWIERQIQTGNLAPGARGMSRDEAAHQFNSSNALTPSDDDYLYTPGQAQQAARDALATIGIEVADNTRVLLTDMSTGPRCTYHLLNPGQVTAAAEQHYLVTGEHISADALIGALPWA